MNIKGKYPETTPLYAAFLSVGAVAAIVVFIIVLNLNPSDAPAVRPSQTTTTTAVSTTAEPQGYVPEAELGEEMKDAATELIFANYKVLSLYYTKGLDHKEEPYGNAPEDGYFTVKSDEYTSLSQLEELVDKTFVLEQAEATKTNSLSYGPIYKERAGGELGIIENFTPMSYNISWDNPDFKISPVSDTECVISIKLHDRDTGEEAVRTGEMVKTADGWRLKTILF